MIEANKTNILVIREEKNGEVYVNKTGHCILREKSNTICRVLYLSDNYHFDFIGDLYPEYKNLFIPIVTDVIELEKEIGMATNIIIGYAPPKGELEQKEKEMYLRFAKKGATVINGLHDIMREENIVNLREHPDAKMLASGNISEKSIRILTVGTDYSIGKMTTTLEMYKGMSESGYKASWLATGQTGVMLNQNGCVLDSAIIDFMPGLLENKIKEMQEEYILIEGQGSIFHPAYSPTSYGLFHTSKPHFFVLCHKAGATVGHMGNQLPTLVDALKFYSLLARGLGFETTPLMISLNSRGLLDEEYKREKKKIEKETGIQCYDLLREKIDYKKMFSNILVNGESIYGV